MSGNTPYIKMIVAIACAGLICYGCISKRNAVEPAITSNQDITMQNGMNIRQDQNFHAKIKIDLTEFQKMNNLFSLALYNSLKSKEGNLFFSPYSIQTALAMTYAGAHGETEEEMKEVLFFKDNTEEFHKPFGYFSRSVISDSAEGYQVQSANRIFVQKEFDIEDSYLEINKKHYNSPVEKVNFIDNAEREAARLFINNWVSDNTNQKIKDLIPEDGLNYLTRLVLANAVYFYSNWETSFNASQTSKMPFHISDKQEKEIHFMQQSGQFKYYEDEYLQTIEIPYKDNKASFIILLPRNKNQLGEVEKQINLTYINKVMAGMDSQKVKLQVPKFKLEENIELSSVLKNMGMASSFSDRADFSGITGTDNLKIDKVYHKAFIEIDEKGTEAAAATAVTMALKSVRIEEEKEILFRADHPFIFLLKENNTNAILFAGRLSKPD